MSDIQFEEDQEFSRSPEVTQTPLFVRLVLKTGIVSTQKQAEYVLLGIVAIAIVTSMYLVVPHAAKSTVPHQPGDELLLVPRIYTQ